MKNLTKSIRTFFAVPLNPDMQIAMQKIIKTLHQRKFGDRIKWSVPENLHLTLRFLGDTPAEKIEPFITRVAEALREIKSFVLPLDDLRLFPSAIHPHAIVVSCPLTEALAKLVHALENVVIALEFPAEKRPYLPHITLGRLRGNHAPDLLDIASELPKELMVQEVVFYHSELSENGSKYIELEKFQLGLPYKD